MALVNAISGESDQKGPVTSASPTSDDGGGGGGGESAPATPTGNAASPAESIPLVIRVTGQPTTVVVRVADAQGKVLTNGRLDTGDTLQYDEAPLQVVASNGGSLQVTIYGEPQPQKPNGQRGQWFVGDQS
ncbi:RodZ domain-containing protein [Actinomadura sp. 7K507]|uniref:RodZ domain-containing protein n=1 Tax=Actinomadura sp. 7K507 TaxID=2530365 RepID=UPI001FB64FF2|nr:RodZ domain-containing protein [Actinomadura sp. 7K507]